MKTYISIALAGLATMLVIGPSARADDVNDPIDRIREHAECVSRCQRESFSCMARCPNGGSGASCRADCLLDNNNCGQNCS